MTGGKLTSISRVSFLAVAGFTLFNFVSCFCWQTKCISTCSIRLWLLNRNEDHPGKQVALCGRRNSS